MPSRRVCERGGLESQTQKSYLAEFATYASPIDPRLAKNIMLAVGWAKPVFGLGWVRVGSVVLTGLAWVGVGCCLSVPARTGARIVGVVLVLVLV